MTAEKMATRENVRLKIHDCGDGLRYMEIRSDCDESIFVSGMSSQTVMNVGLALRDHGVTSVGTIEFVTEPTGSESE